MSTFEINCAIIGPVSAGKSTLLNALFCNKLSDMKIGRTTMLPQVYKQISIQSEQDFSKILEKNREINDNIINNDTQLSNSNCKEITYNIEKRLDILEALPEEINFNIYDLPGLNDAKTEEIYFNYLENSIDKFDIIIFVVDIKDAFLTSSGPPNILNKLISFLNNNNNNNKEKCKTKEEEEINNNRGVQIIVLVNKCDDIEYHKSNNEFILNDEYQDLFDKAEQYVTDKVKNIKCIKEIKVLPISLEDSYIYRMFIKNPKFNLDIKHLNKFGINEIGKTKWSKKTEEEKQTFILEYIKECDLEEQLIQCGFNNFKKILNNLLHKNFVYNTILYRICQKYNEKEKITMKLITKKSYLIDYIKTYITHYKYIRELYNSLIIQFKLNNYEKYILENPISKLIETDLMNYLSKFNTYVNNKSDINITNNYLEYINLFIKEDIINNYNILNTVKDKIKKNQNKYYIHFIRNDVIIKGTSSYNYNYTCTQFIINDNTNYNRCVNENINELITILKLLKKNNYKKEDFEKLLFINKDKICEFKQGSIFTVLLIYGFLEKETPIIKFCNLLLKDLIINPTLVFDFYKDYLLLKKHLYISHGSHNISKFHILMYSQLLDFELNKDYIKYNGNFKEFLINLKLTNSIKNSNIIPDECYVTTINNVSKEFYTQNYYGNKELILSEYYYLFEIYNNYITA